MQLKELIAGYAQPGQLAWIGVRPERRVAMQAVDRGVIREDGLEGDHGRPGKRAVTLIQQEHFPVISSYLGGASLRPELLRRNLVVQGINLAALKGRQVQIGQALLEITVICAPCSRMEETLGQGGYSAVRGHGGWCAQVLHPGVIEVGDVVRPVD